MPDQTIKCPKCGAEIPLTEALTNQIEGALRTQLEAETNKKTIELENRKQALDKHARELEVKELSITEQVAEQLKAERRKIAELEKTRILAEQSEQTKALEQELEEKRKQLTKANEKELELRKQRRKLEEEKAAIELTVQRQLDIERKKIIEKVSKEAADEQQLKMREKDDQLTAMKKQIDELKRKSEIGSQEAQGEALEEELQEYLERSFPCDNFEEVKKGARGADVIQIVHNSSGRECGKILWESKNTKDFQKGWTMKIKSDQQEANAEKAVIMSVALPGEVKSFGLYDGVWITDYKSAIGLANALRQGLIEATRQKAITAGRDSIKDVVYNYVTSQEFNLHIKTIANAYNKMKEDLETEKRSMIRIWNKREKQISLILENVTGMYGSIEGIVGNQKALPEIKTMSLDAIVNEDESITN